MPARKNHVILNGEECKECSRCNTIKPLCEFHKDGGHTWDGLVTACKDCIKEDRQLNPRTRAVRAWGNLNKRVANGEKTYASRGIKIAISREDFLTWYQENSFPHCIVDRIDNELDYSLGNIQMLTLTQHNYKRRLDRLAAAGVKEPDGHRYCFGCESLLPVGAFGRKRSAISTINPLGLRHECKACTKSKRNKRR